MNGNKNNSIISVKQSKELSHRDASVSTDNTKQEDELRPTTWPTTEDVQISMRNIYNTIKTYVLSSEDDVGIQCATRDFEMKDREPMFVIVDSSCVSDPSSREMLIESKTVRKIKKIVQPIDMPSTSTDMTTINTIEPLLKESESTDEMLMIDINLQSDNEISIENDIDNDSIVMSYLRNKTLPLCLEGTLLTTKKKSSILEDLSKMETIPEGETLNSVEIEQDNEDTPERTESNTD